MATGDLESETTAEQAAQVGVRPPHFWRTAVKHKIDCSPGPAAASPTLSSPGALLLCSAAQECGGAAQPGPCGGGTALCWQVGAIAPPQTCKRLRVWRSVERGEKSHPLAGAVVSEPWSTEE